jgi:hypothetical protein
MVDTRACNKCMREPFRGFWYQESTKTILADAMRADKSNFSALARTSSEGETRLLAGGEVGGVGGERAGSAWGSAAGSCVAAASLDPEALDLLVQG